MERDYLNLPYLGITGFTAEDEVTGAINCIDTNPGGFGKYLFMNGILVNQTTLKGHVSPKYPKRYPEPARTARLFRPSENTLHLYHYNTSSQDFYHELEKLIEFGGPNLHGFQLNMAWPNPRILERFRDEGNKHVIVLQIGRKAFNRIDNDPKKLVAKLNYEYSDTVDYVLLDPSGGQGREMDVEIQKKYLRVVYNCLMNRLIRFGVAGGISPYNHDRTILPFLEEFDDLSFDLEGSIRDKETDELLFTETRKAIDAYYKNVVKRTLEVCEV